MMLAVSPVLRVICPLITLYTFVVLAAILMSWFPIQPGTAAYSIWRFLRSLTYPVLLPLRRAIPPIGGVFDLSPLILIIGLQIAHGIIC